MNTDQSEMELNLEAQLNARLEVKDKEMREIIEAIEKKHQEEMIKLKAASNTVIPPPTENPTPQDPSSSTFNPFTSQPAINTTQPPPTQNTIPFNQTLGQDPNTYPLNQFNHLSNNPIHLSHQFGGMTVSNNALASYLMQELERLKRDEHATADIFDPTSYNLNKLGNLPAKFKMPDMEKFKGKGCPTAHVEAYTLAMYTKGASTEAMAMCFHQTLAGPARDWFMTLPVETKNDWRKASEAFQLRYKDNKLYRTTRRDLEQVLQKDGESFSDFSQRWRNKLGEIVDQPSALDQIDMFIKCCKPEYRKELSSSYWPDLSAVYLAGIRLDEFSRENKNRYGVNNTGHHYNNSANKGNVSAANTSVNNLGANKNQGRPAQPKTERPSRNYTSLGNMTYGDMFKILERKGELEPKYGYRVPNMNIRPLNKYCEYHRNTGHETDSCFHLKEVIQDMFDEGKIELPKCEE